MELMTVGRMNKSDGTAADTAIALTATGYTRSVKIGAGGAFCVSLLAKSPTGTPDLDVYLEQTHIDPDTIASVSEGIAASIANGWVTPTGSSKVADITDKTAWHHFTVSPVALTWLRLKIDGQGANPADCTAEIYISRRESD